jgi:hypothetical protein
VQLPALLKPPLPSLEKLTVPDGVLAVPESVSDTVAVHDVKAPTDAEGVEHATDVDVKRADTIG